jgi:hypothetical protein
MPSDPCGYCSGPAHATRLEAIICEVQSRRVTMYRGRDPRNDELLVAEIVRLRKLLAEPCEVCEGGGPA